MLTCQHDLLFRIFSFCPLCECKGKKRLESLLLCYLSSISLCVIVIVTDAVKAGHLEDPNACSRHIRMHIFNY